jgi:hypothetical protein
MAGAGEWRYASRAALPIHVRIHLNVRILMLVESGLGELNDGREVRPRQLHAVSGNGVVFTESARATRLSLELFWQPCHSSPIQRCLFIPQSIIFSSKSSLRLVCFVFAATPQKRLQATPSPLFINIRIQIYLYRNIHPLGHLRQSLFAHHLYLFAHVLPNAFIRHIIVLQNICWIRVARTRKHKFVGVRRGPVNA